MLDTYDFVIVGAGAGGCTVAYRMSELADASVLILEAGPKALPEAVQVPYRWNELLLTELDWAYNSTPQPGLANRQVYSAAGRATGGGSVLYHMMHVRARPADLDNWAYQGCPGWSFLDCLPYFQRSENQQDGTNPTAGRGGPITVVNAKDAGNPISQTFLDACVELGYPLVDDFNATPFGAGWQHVDIKDGRRGGVLTSYLQPALQRPNVTLKTGALATRLVLENGRCTGVEFRDAQQATTVRAGRAVILCCGAIETPKLLMLSGIGNADHLRALGIPVNVDLPGVGENFQDHPLVIGPFGRLAEPGADPKGNMTEVGLFWGSAPGQPVPDLEICLVHRAPFGDAFFANVVNRLQTGQPIQPVQQLVDPRVILSLPGLVRPFSRGWVRLRASDPAVQPDINANYGGEPADIDRIVTMVEIARQIYQTKAFARLGLQEVGPGPAIATNAQLRQWVIENTGSYYHFVGSCRMGSDRMAVVDPTLKVYGVDGLHIADGSIMPSIPAANPHTTIVMIGERAADFIKAER
ncbi:MAG: GMC family oxidoreductase N-terminal domain-containing protein [Defluviicoccus sp.]